MKKIAMIFVLLSAFPIGVGAINFGSLFKGAGKAIEGSGKAVEETVGSAASRHTIQKTAEEASNVDQLNKAPINVSVHSPLPFPGNAAILAAISAGETPALPGGSERLPINNIHLPEDENNIPPKSAGNEAIPVAKPHHIEFLNFSKDNEYNSTNKAISSEEPILVNASGKPIDKNGNTWNSVDLQYKKQAEQLFLKLWDDLPKKVYFTPNELEQDLRKALYSNIENSTKAKNSNKNKSKKYELDRETGELKMLITNTKGEASLAKINSHNIIHKIAELAFAGLAGYGGINIADKLLPTSLKPAATTPTNQSQSQDLKVKNQKNTK